MGIGYPDVTLFPIIADLFEVPIGVLFGEINKEENMAPTPEHKRRFVFKPLNIIQIMVGNICQIEVINGESDHSSLEAEGDAKFIEYLSVENTEGKLHINIKNPTGSDIHWVPYDRGNYEKNNKIRIHSGVSAPRCYVINYLDLETMDCLTHDNTYKWICQKSGLSK